MTATTGRYEIEAIEATWQVQIRGSAGPSSLAVPAPSSALQAGPGPGALVWTRVIDHEVHGLAAPWAGGHFKIMEVSPAVFALFFEGNDCCRGLLVSEARDTGAALVVVDHLKVEAGAQKWIFHTPTPFVPRPWISELLSRPRKL